MNGRKLGVILVAVWFLLWAALAITNFSFELSNVLMGVLAAAAGLLLLFDR